MRINGRMLDFIASLSLANLIMVKIWLMLLPHNPGRSFWLAYSPVNSYIAAVANTLIIGLVLWCVALYVSRKENLAALFWLLVSLLTFCFALNGIRSNFGWGMQTLYKIFGTGGAIATGIITILLLATTLIWIIRNRQLMAPYCIRIPLLFAPFILVTYGQSVFAVQQLEPKQVFTAYDHQNLVLSPEDPSSIPVVWIIFDELDFGLVFNRRPKNLLLPEFDRLQQASLFATQAYSPSTATTVSIPALLTGKTLKKTVPINASDMDLVGIDNNISRLKMEKTIISEMRNQGYKTAIFGWYFPYSRLLNDVSVAKGYHDLFFPGSEQLAKTVILQLRSLVETGYFSPFGDSLAVKNHISITTTMQKDVLQHLTSNMSGFTFLHYPIPHSMNIYNSKTKMYGSNRNVKEGYLDNVALADLLLGEIRATMTKAGTWDKSLVILSSDHALRENAYDGIVNKLHVPFMVKMPHQTDGMRVDSRFETVRTRDMIVEIVNGKLKTPLDAQSWMTVPR